MWALKSAPHVEEDRGVVLAWVAIMMAVLLGIGALVIDIGALLVERRELQNGADAAALAVAQDCALGDCSTASALASQFANLNAKDGVSAVEVLCGDDPWLLLSECAEEPPARASGAAGWVRVGTRTETEDGGDQVSFLLLPIMNWLLGITNAAAGATVRARASAAWGPLGSATTLPITFSECEFQRLAFDESGFPVGTTTIYSKTQGDDQDLVDEGCEPRSAPGGTVEGNFGWLNLDSGLGCGASLSVGDEIIAPGNPGNMNLLRRAPCDKSMVRNQEVLIPLFNRVEGVGNNVRYTIAGFAGFRVTGYQLSGSTWPTGFSCPPPPGNVGGTGNLRCFQGEFTRIATHGDFGFSFDFGAYAIRMVE